ncbi:hypothetical protein EDB83DRAFT_2315128 [Lactarius deliciosus]|nr:hypothetical protein EDB83DRAFT_2315128 [Lactarius deliciosus]
MKVGQQRHQLDLGKSAIEQLGDLIVTVLHKVYTALMCPRCSKMVEMGQILLEVNLDSPLNNAKKITLWWPGSATTRVELISSMFDNPGIDYNKLAGSDDIRTYCDIDPSPSLLPLGVSVETIAKLMHDELLHNAEFVRQVHLVASLQELLKFQSKTTLNRQWHGFGYPARVMATGWDGHGYGWQLS